MSHKAFPYDKACVFLKLGPGHPVRVIDTFNLDHLKLSRWASGVPGMSRYITTKNRKNTPERLELKKYNPYLKKVTVHKEIK